MDLHLLRVSWSRVRQALKLAQPDIDLLVMEQQLQDYQDTQMLARGPERRFQGSGGSAGLGFRGLGVRGFRVRSGLGTFEMRGLTNVEEHVGPCRRFWCMPQRDVDV